MNKILFFLLVSAAALSVPYFKNQVSYDDLHVESETVLKPKIQQLVDDATSHKFIEQNCFKCHDEDVQKGDFQLDNLAWNFDDKASFEVWEKVYEAVDHGQMPPKKKPSSESINKFLDELRSKLVAAEEKFRGDRGRSVVRRLTRKEYENTIRDIFDLPYIQMTRFLPEDGDHHGFAKNHDSLDFSAVHLKSYIDAANALLQNSVMTGPEPQAKTFVGEFNRINRKDHYLPGLYKENGDFWLFSNGFATHHVETGALTEKIKHSGFYEIEFKAKAVQTKKPYILKLFSDADHIFQNEWTHIKLYDVKPEKWQSFKERVWLEKNSEVCFTAPEAKHRKSGARILTQPGIALKEIKVSGPFYKEWPLKRHTLLWGDIAFTKAKVKNKTFYRIERPKNFEEKAHSLIQNFMQEVSRKPIDRAETELFYGIFKNRFEASNNFKKSLLTAYKAILCSPSFLYKEETRGDLEQHELASRLSYFLWNSKPDAELLSLAQSKSLQGVELKKQVDRLLEDKKSDRFIDDFNDQWLHLSELFATDPDPRLYPEASPALFRLMKAETNSFIKEIIKKDLSVTNIIDSDFAMLNGRLARHYGLKEIEGTELKPHKLPEGHERGGIITQGSVLKVTANGTVTSPITRGVWFLENIVGTPPPLPPNAVPAFEPEASGKLTLREGLAEHRTNAACNGCHKRIDPPGFAFESFDPVGGFRTKYRVYHKNRYKFGRAVESSDVMTDGASFKSIQEFKALILRDKELIVKNLLNKLTIYSTGQDLSFSDDDEVSKILSKTVSSNYGMRSLIHELVQSKIFLRK